MNLEKVHEFEFICISCRVQITDGGSVIRKLNLYCYIWNIESTNMSHISSSMLYKFFAVDLKLQTTRTTSKMSTGTMPSWMMGTTRRRRSGDGCKGQCRRRQWPTRQQYGLGFGEETKWGRQRYMVMGWREVALTWWLTCRCRRHGWHWRWLAGVGGMADAATWRWDEEKLLPLINRRCSYLETETFLPDQLINSYGFSGGGCQVACHQESQESLALGDQESQESLPSRQACPL